MSCRSTRARVPKPPGISRMSTAGSVPKDQRGTMTRPPAAVTGPPVSPTRPVSKKAFPASSQALMKASKGPTASSGSTSSKTWIATTLIDPGASRSEGTVEPTQRYRSSVNHPQERRSPQQMRKGVRPLRLANGPGRFLAPQTAPVLMRIPTSTSRVVLPPPLRMPRVGDTSPKSRPVAMRI